LNMLLKEKKESLAKLKFAEAEPENRSMINQTAMNQSQNMLLGVNNESMFEYNEPEGFEKETGNNALENSIFLSQDTIYQSPYKKAQRRPNNQNQQVKEKPIFSKVRSENIIYPGTNYGISQGGVISSFEIPDFASQKSRSRSVVNEKDNDRDFKEKKRAEISDSKVVEKALPRENIEPTLEVSLMSFEKAQFIKGQESNTNETVFQGTEGKLESQTLNIEEEEDRAQLEKMRIKAVRKERLRNMLSKPPEKPPKTSYLELWHEQKIASEKEMIKRPNQDRTNKIPSFL